MRAVKSLMILFGCLLIASCHQTNSTTDNKSVAAIQTDSSGNINLDSVPCEQIGSKKVIYAFADDVLDDNSYRNNNNIWNLSELDSAHYTVFEDYFTNSVHKNKMVLVQGTAGMSAGNASNLLMLFGCMPRAKVLWAGQVAPFTDKDIIDVNNDGIKDIVVTTGAVWMGEFDENFAIVTYKNGIQKDIFSASTFSVIETGAAADEDTLRMMNDIGDTLEITNDCKLIQMDKRYQVQQIRTLKIYNGGITVAEATKMAKVSVDTILVDLSDKGR